MIDDPSIAGTMCRMHPRSRSRSSLFEHISVFLCVYLRFTDLKWMERGQSNILLYKRS